MELIEKMNNENSGKRKAIAVGCGAFAVRGLVSGFLPLLYVMFPIRMIAIAIFLHFCMSGVGDLLSGFCVSKIGYRFSAFAGLILTAIGMLALGFHPGMSGSVGLIVSSVLTGLGCGVAGAASGNIVRWYSDDTDKKIRLMYILYAAAQLASLAVSLIFLLAAGIWAWNIVAAMWGIFPVGCAMYLVLLPFEEPEYDRNGETWRELFGNASFVILFCLMFFAGAAERSMGQWIAAYTEGSSETFGVILALCAPALFTICIGVSRILYSKFSDRIKLQRFMVYGCALGTAAYLLAILAGNNVLSLVGCILVGAFTGILIPGTFSLASAKVPAAGASIFTLLLLAGDLGYGVGPALVGIAAGIFDFNLKKGMFIALIFPIAMIVTIMKVNKNLAGKLIREKKTWIALACATLVVTLSAFTGGCEQSTAVTPPKPTPTQVIMETPVPLNTPTFTPSPALEPTEAPTPTPFSGCGKLRSILIPDSVREIGSGAFSSCSGLEQVRLPANLTVIRSDILKACTGLRQIVIPNRVKSIESGAFYGCVSLTDVQMPPGISIARPSQREDFCNPPMEMEPFRYTIHIHGAFDDTPFGKRHGFA